MAFLGVYMLVMTGNSISERKAAVAGLEQQLAFSQARAAALQSFTDFASLEESRTSTVYSLARSRFDWERVMRELALVIPERVALTSLSGAVSGAAESSSGSSGGDIEAPNLTMTGCAHTHASVATMIAAMRDIDGVTRVGLESSAKAETDEQASADPSVTEAPATDTDGTEDCARSRDATFELTIAFDEVEVDPTSGAPVPPTEPSDGSGAVTGDGSGVAETEQEQDKAKDSAGSAQGKADKAVDRYIPGA